MEARLFHKWDSKVDLWDDKRVVKGWQYWCRTIIMTICFSSSNHENLQNLGSSVDFSQASPMLMISWCELHSLHIASADLGIAGVGFVPSMYRSEKHQHTLANRLVDSMLIRVLRVFERCKLMYARFSSVRRSRGPPDPKDFDPVYNSNREHTSVW
jgi:hypothetical protein